MGRGEALRQSSQLLCGPVRQAVEHPAGSAPQSISKKAELSDLADSSAWYPKKGTGGDPLKTHQVQQKTERRISAALRLVFVAALLLGQIALAFFLSTGSRQRCHHLHGAGAGGLSATPCGSITAPTAPAISSAGSSSF